MIHVVAVITAKPGQRGAVLQAFHTIVPTVRAEQGCIEYVPVIDATGAGAARAPLGEDTFMVVEKWESLETLQAHAQSAHMAAYGEKTKDLVANAAVHVLTEA